MKTLYVMRHAKSSWTESGLDDIDRPLIQQGEKRTHRIVDFLSTNHAKIDLILSSPAVRALATAKIIARGLLLPEEQIRIENKIYLAEPEQLLELFDDMPEQVDRIMIIGHNPGITGFLNEFMERKVDLLPTSAVVCINFDTKEWSEVAARNAEVKFLVYPKMLG